MTPPKTLGFGGCARVRAREGRQIDTDQLTEWRTLCRTWPMAATNKVGAAPLYEATQTASSSR
jgi:hypothetical protein